MTLLPSELPRLVHHYLIEEGYVEAASLLASHCPHLKIYSQASNFNSELSIFIGPTLLDLLEDYFKAKEYVIERLKKLKSYNFRPLDSCLLTRLESLVASLVPNVQSNVRKNEGGAGSDVIPIVNQDESTGHNNSETAGPTLSLDVSLGEDITAPIELEAIENPVHERQLSTENQTDEGHGTQHEDGHPTTEHKTVIHQGAATEIGNQLSVGEKHAVKETNVLALNTPGRSSSSVTSNGLLAAKDRLRCSGVLLEACLSETLPTYSDEDASSAISGKTKRNNKTSKADARTRDELLVVARSRSRSRSSIRLNLDDFCKTFELIPANRGADTIEKIGNPTAQFHDAATSINPTQIHQQESIGTSSSESILSQADEIVNHEMSPCENVCNQLDRASSPEMEPLRLEESLDDTDTDQDWTIEQTAPRVRRRRKRRRGRPRKTERPRGRPPAIWERDTTSTLRKTERERLIQELIALATRDMTDIVPPQRKKVRHHR